MTPRHKRKGVSEVLGALLLIVVVVAAVASLSVFLTQAQTNAQNRQAYITSVQNENLQLTYAQFSPNSPAMLWELDNTTQIPSCHSHCVPRYYIQIISSSELTLAQVDSHNLLTITTLNSGYTGAGPAMPASSLFIHKGEIAELDTANNTIKFGVTSTPNSNAYVFNPATWSNVTLTVRNLNTAASGIYQVQVNTDWLLAWSQVDQTGHTLIASLGPAISPLVIPAKGFENLNLSLASLNIPRNESLKITLLSSAGNLFTTQYSQPTSIVKSSTVSENYQIVTRDVVSFDGSNSFSTNNAIQSYMWQVEVPTNAAGCSLTAYSNPANLDVAYVPGQTLQYLPESIFSSNLSTDCITGPIKAQLVVVDDNGFVATSQPVTISADPNIAPISSLAATSTPGACPNTVTVTVKDIFGRTVNGVVVTAITTSGDAATSSAETTSGGGQATFAVTCTSGGSIQFQTGSLPPVGLSFT